MPGKKGLDVAMVEEDQSRVKQNIKCIRWRGAGGTGTGKNPDLRDVINEQPLKKLYLFTSNL